MDIHVPPHLSTNMTTVLRWFFHCSRTGRSRLTFWPPPGYLTTSPPLHCSPIPTTCEDGLSIVDQSLQKPVGPLLLNITSTFKSNSRTDRMKRWYPSVSSVAMVTICSLRSSAQSSKSWSTKQTTICNAYYMCNRSVLHSSSVKARPVNIQHMAQCWRTL